MANEITKTSLAETITAEEIQRDLVEAARSNLVMMPLVQQGMISVGTNTLQISRRYASTSFTSRTNDTTVFANVDYIPTSISITPTTIGRTYYVSDEADAASIVPALDSVAYDGGRDMAEKIDTDLCALGDGFSSDAGTTGAAPDLDTLQLALYTLAAAKAPRPYGFVGASVFWYHVRLLLAGTQATLGAVYAQLPIADLLGQAGANGFAGTIFGVPCWESQTVKSINAAVDYANFAMSIGPGSPLVCAWKERRDGLWTPRTEMQRRPEYASTVLTLTTCYGTGETADDRGVQITATQTA